MSQASAPVSPIADVMIQAAAALVPASRRARFLADLSDLMTALEQGRDGDAADIVETYHLGANFGAVIMRYRARANGCH